MGEARVGGNHRGGALVVGGDDLGVIDPAQIPGGDREVGMPELALDHEQGDPFAGHLYRVGVPELVGREPPANPGCASSAVELGAESGR